MKKHRVLIPLDGSGFSRRIIPYVRQFFYPMHDDLILFRVASEPAAAHISVPRPIVTDGLFARGQPYPVRSQTEHALYPSYVHQIWDNLQSALADELREYADGLRNDGYRVEVVIRTGDPAEEIIDFVSHGDIDLVAMATHGRTGLSRLIMGSVATEVLRRVTIPVLLIRPSA